MSNLQETLQELMREARLTANALAQQLHLPTPTIHRLAKGEVEDPRLSTLLMIADYFGVTLEALIGRASPNLGVTLLTFHEALHYKTHLKKSARSKTQFSIQISNSFYEPVFFSGSRIVIDTAIKPATGDYVLVKYAGESMALIKKFVSEGKRKYLHALNADIKPTLLKTTDEKIIGVIIKHYQQFRE